MALSYVNPSTGAITSTAMGSATDFTAFDYAEAQGAESVAAYGSQKYDPYRGSGTPHASASVAAIAKHGASGATPGFAHTDASGATADFDGASVTFGVQSSTVTLAGNFIVTSIRLSHGRTRAAVPLAYTLECGGDVTVTWPVV